MSHINGESAVTPRSLRPQARLDRFLTEVERPRRHPLLPWERIGRRRRGHNADMYGSGESDRSIVPQKQANTDSVPLPAESMEGRGLTKENIEQWLLDRTERRVSRSRGLLGVRAAAGLRRAGGGQQ